MSKSSRDWIIILIILLLVIGYNIIFRGCTPSKTQEEIYIEKIDSLEIINDSISYYNSLLLLKIDSLENLSSKVDSVIVEIEHWYEKELIDITNQPISSDIHFFTEYLSKTDSGFVSSNNSKSVKED